MKRKTIVRKMTVLAAMSMMMASLAACGAKADQEANPAENGETQQNTQAEAEQAAQGETQQAAGAAIPLDSINTVDYVSVGEYKGIQVEEAEPEVAEADLDSYIDYLLGINPPEGVENGDTVIIDYVGTLDGVAFDGGTASGAYLTIGSGQYIEGFEEGLVGAKTGDTVELNLTFPENYTAEDLAGKDVVFTVTVNTIMSDQPQELTDEFVQGLTEEFAPGMPEDCDTVEEFREYVYHTLYEEAVAFYESNVKTAIITKLMENSEFKADPPQEMVDKYVETLSFNLNAQAESYGVTLADFMMMYYGMDEATYTSEIENQSKMSAQQYIMLQDIANKEGLNVTDEELETEMAKMAASAGVAVDEFKAQTDQAGFKEYLMGEKVLDFLMENAVVTAPVVTAAEEAVTTAEETVAEEAVTAAEETLAEE